jgi:hypothetical protein
MWFCGSAALRCGLTWQQRQLQQYRLHHVRCAAVLLAESFAGTAAAVCCVLRSDLGCDYHSLVFGEKKWVWCFGLAQVAGWSAIVMGLGIA